jgi:Family of unknown function (DUF5427)
MAQQQAASKPRSSHDDVLSFLDDLDSRSKPPVPSSSPAQSPAPVSGPDQSNPQDAQSVLDFIDEITQRSSTPGGTQRSPTPAGGKKLTQSTPDITVTEAKDSTASSTSGTPSREPSSSVDELARKDAPPAAARSDAGWGWGSVWSQASSVIQQARNAAEEVWPSPLGKAP